MYIHLFLHLLVKSYPIPHWITWLPQKNQFTTYCGSIPCIVDYLFCLIVLYVSPYTILILFDYYNTTVNLEIVCFVLQFLFPLNSCIFNWLQYFRVLWILSSKQQYIQVLVSPQTFQHLDCLFFFHFLVILMDLKWHLIIILICLPSITTNLEHLFICFLPIHMSFVKFL